METQQDTAVGLLKRWRELAWFLNNGGGITLPDWRIVPGATCGEDIAKAEIDAMARRLDSMCREAGIGIYENQFVYKTNEWWGNQPVKSDAEIMVIAANGKLSASEQQAIQEWLLIKEQLKDKK